MKDLVNKQNNENIEIINILNEKKKENKVYLEQINNLKKENEELKKEINNYKEKEKSNRNSVNQIGQSISKYNDLLCQSSKSGEIDNENEYEKRIEELIQDNENLEEKSKRRK